MTTLFIDTSALAKRYVIETGTRWVRSQIRPSARNVIVVTQLASVEMFALLARRQRENSISATAASRLRTVFLRHLKQEYLTIPVTMPVLVQARTLVGTYPLRMLEALQLASGLRAKTVVGGPITFLTGDTNLLAAAALEGLATDNPNLHP